MKQKTWRRSAELNEVKHSNKYRTQWKKKLVEEAQNWIK